MEWKSIDGKTVKDKDLIVGTLWVDTSTDVYQKCITDDGRTEWILVEQKGNKLTHEYNK